METVRDRHGRLGGLFANAGTGTSLLFENITGPDFDHGVDANFKGVFFTVPRHCRCWRTEARSPSMPPGPFTGATAS
ncbi:hypothetical protein [Streptomyces sp. NPDC092952]|uniref:hypothetical protein n=1 Tax=Streptomyces sp. NPDC092952 TaxID=3366018 RepID=UPI00381A911F